MLDSLLAGVSTLALLPFLPRVFSSDTGYRIQRSLRFRNSNNPYLTRTPAVASNRAVWTWSGWAKRGQLAAGMLFSAGTDGNNFSYIYFTGGTLEVGNYVGGAYRAERSSNSSFRDPSAWYHIVVAANGTSSLNMWVNGVQVTSWLVSIGPDSNNWFFNSTVPHAIGAVLAYPPPTNFDGLMAEVHFVDGQALDPTNFGEIDAATGVWSPKSYTGTYGTNGFKLDFSDNSAATAAAIGKDTSGNGNNWTPTGISVTAGAANDSLVDTPTNYGGDTGLGGEVRGNYCTFNPLGVLGLNVALLTLSEGNLVASQPSTGTTRYAGGTFAPHTGKWGYQVKVNFATPGSLGVGVRFGASYGIYLATGATVGLSGSPTFASYTDGDFITVAWDVDAGTCRFYKNGVLQGAGDYAHNGGAGASLAPYVFANDTGTSTGNFYLNCGQSAFAYPLPFGFKALCTQNLPAPSIIKPNQYFDATVYTGTGATQSIVNAGGFQPDLVWIKNRANSAADHILTDSVRGSGVFLMSNQTAAEAAASFTTFNPNGFSVSTGNVVNQSGSPLVGWQWQKGVTPGFDIVAFNFPASGPSTISHSLGAAPKLVIVKGRSNGVNPWVVYHASAGNTGYLALNATAAFTVGDSAWNNTSPSSSVVTLGTGFVSANYGANGIAYLWSEVPGFSRFGSYTGNGSADGPFVWCGFRPRYVLIKRTDAANDWVIFDTARGAFNLNGTKLYADLSAGEDVGSGIDILANGFKCRDTSGYMNASGGTYIFAAFAEAPFKTARAR